MIYTTYFAKLKSLPEQIVPVAICISEPKWYKGLCYKALAPKWGFFSEWKKTKNNSFYIRCFNAQVLSKLSAKKVLEDLEQLACSKDIALVCYEKPEGFCHRHLVARWLIKNGIEAKEFGT